MKGNRSCRHPIGCGDGIQEQVRLRDNVEGQLVVLFIPVRAGCPGGVFVVPCPFDTLEIEVSQAADSAGERAGLANGMAGRAGGRLHGVSFLWNAAMPVDI